MHYMFLMQCQFFCRNVEKKNEDVTEQFQQQFIRNLEDIRAKLMAKISTNDQALTSNMVQIGK